MKNKSIRDTYKIYKKEIKNPTDLDTYVKLTAAYNEFMIEKVLEGHEIGLPERVGTLCIQGKKIKPLLDEKGTPTNVPVNWKATYDLWKRNPKAEEQNKVIRYLNEETDGIRYKYFWSKKNVWLENKYLYSLKVVRRHKRGVADLVRKGKEFAIIENNAKI
jgi:hypothetical protein